ncbi:MAG: ycjS [Mucilaginibacter sp.]|nr:ycjS [Mucilaginibacter sp.]
MNPDQQPQTTINRRKFIEKASVMSAFMIVPRFVLGGKGYTAPSDLISLGFIGTGKQAGGLQGSFFDTNEVKIIAAADVYGAKLQQFAGQVNQRYALKAAQTKYAGCATYADFRDLLSRKDIDAVVIAVPDHWHSVCAILAARAGKDIYCEKPLSLTIKEGRAMVEESRKHKRVFQTGSMQRSWPEFRQAVSWCAMDISAR